MNKTIYLIFIVLSILQITNADWLQDCSKCGEIKYENEDISGNSFKETRLLRNEIFARKGYIFKDKRITTRFKKKSWYKPRFNSVNHITLNEIEQHNIKLFKAREKIGKITNPSQTYGDIKEQVEKLSHLLGDSFAAAYTEHAKYHTIITPSGADYTLVSLAYEGMCSGNNSITYLAIFSRGFGECISEYTHYQLLDFITVGGTRWRSFNQLHKVQIEEVIDNGNLGYIDFTFPISIEVDRHQFEDSFATIRLTKGGVSNNLAGMQATIEEIN